MHWLVNEHPAQLEDFLGRMARAERWLGTCSCVPATRGGADISSKATQTFRFTRTRSRR